MDKKLKLDIPQEVWESLDAESAAGLAEMIEHHGGPEAFAQTVADALLSNDGAVEGKLADGTLFKVSPIDGSLSDEEFEEEYGISKAELLRRKAMVQKLGQP